MKISVIHPSRGRLDQAIETAKKWINNSDTEIDYNFSFDNDDFTEKNSLINFASVFSHNNISAIDAINKVAELIVFDLLVIVSDDFDCPEHWDTLLLEALKGKSDFCAKTIDGHQDWLITLPILDRKYYERFGYIYHPSYSHIYADAEMTTVAWMLDRYISLPIEFKHNHYSVTGQQPDAINRKNNATWGTGRLNFMKRWANGFDLNMYFEKPWPIEELKKQGLVYYINEYWDFELSQLRKLPI